MKAFLLLFPLVLAGCDSVPTLTNSVAAFSQGYADGVAAYQAPAYCPPPITYTHGSTWTPNSPQPFQYYNYNSFDGSGSVWTPGAAQPFTYFH